MSTPVVPASLPARTRAAAPPDDPTIWRVDDALWTQLEPLLRVERPRAKGGRPRHPDRPLLDGIIWLLRTGAQWAALPGAFGPTSTCHDRFQEWVASGAFARAWAVLLAAQVADGCLTKAPLGKKGGPENPWPPAATPPTGAKPAPSATC